MAAAAEVEAEAEAGEVAEAAVVEANRRISSTAAGSASRYPGS